MEVGGWALTKEKRCTGEALRTALATYGLAQPWVAVAPPQRRCAIVPRPSCGDRRKLLEIAGEPVPPIMTRSTTARWNREIQFDAPNQKYRRWTTRLVQASDVPVLALAS